MKTATVMTPSEEQADSFKIKQAYSVCGKTFDTVTQANTYALIDQAKAYALNELRKREAHEILSSERPLESHHFATGVDNKTVIDLAADHLMAFAEIVALMQEAQP